MRLIQLVIALFLCQNALAESTVFGNWKTIDDKTHQAKSVIQISQDGEGLKGRIVELINPLKKDPICEKCVGEKKDKPILGLEILNGFKSSHEGQEWKDGEVLDPENGKTYKCRLRLQDGGKALEVRGYIGISLFGRSQTWIRQDPPPQP